MKIVEIREKTIPISSPIRNAYIDFSKMTLSLVAVITDVIRDGKPVVGYGFNSNGRYGQGTPMRERSIPRIMQADPASLVDDTGDNLDPNKIWNTMVTNDKPGGRGRRQDADPPYERPLRGRHTRPQDVGGRRGGIRRPGPGARQAQGREAERDRARLHGGEEEDRGGHDRRGPAPHRVDHGSP